MKTSSRLIKIGAFLACAAVILLPVAAFASSPNTTWDFTPGPEARALLIGGAQWMSYASTLAVFAGVILIVYGFWGGGGGRFAKWGIYTVMAAAFAFTIALGMVKIGNPCAADLLQAAYSGNLSSSATACTASSG